MQRNNALWAIAGLGVITLLFIEPLLSSLNNYSDIFEGEKEKLGDDSSVFTIEDIKSMAPTLRTELSGRRRQHEIDDTEEEEEEEQKE
mmetsp:Transcript_21019/g.29351  ORF Transcript_21019/g.29351 Transcript_21019/m.29351 type:complete len:88 (+) Transcript_21019:167-430(+)